MSSFIHRAAPAHAGPAPVTVLRTTTEAVWILQGLAGVELLPATLLLRPWVAVSGPPTGHPGVSTLIEAGALLNDETVHPTITRWLHTLGAPDIALCANVRRGDDHLRLVIARREQLHVAASRCGDDVTIEEVRGVRDVRDLVARILPLCGSDVEPAPIDPISVRSADLVDGLADMVRGGRALSGLGLSTAQRRMLTAAAEAPLMEASFAVVVHDRRGEHVGLMSASVIDAEQGRLVCGPLHGSDGTWKTQIVPGTPAAAARAVAAVVSSMCVDWTNHAREK